MYIVHVYMRNESEIQVMLIHITNCKKSAVSINYEIEKYRDKKGRERERERLREGGK